MYFTESIKMKKKPSERSEDMTVKYCSKSSEDMTVIYCSKSYRKNTTMFFNLTVMFFVLIATAIYLRQSMIESDSFERRLLQTEPARIQSYQNESILIQQKTPDSNRHIPIISKSIESNTDSEHIPQVEQATEAKEKTQTQKKPNQIQPQSKSPNIISNSQNSSTSQSIQNGQTLDDYLTDPAIQWPSQSEPYHIYSALNPRLVLDVAVASDNYHDLILYQWKNQLNQMYFFRKSHSNFYHIVNAQSKQYMKKSQKFIPISKLSKIKFSKNQDKLWQLIPAKPNVKNSFYILAENGQALDLNQGYAQEFAEIIQYNFHKYSNQVWILRKNQSQTTVGENSIQNFEQKASQLLYKVMHVPDSINQCITLEQMKQQMHKSKMPLPSWLKKPPQHTINAYDLPLQTTQKQFMLYLKKSLTQQEEAQKQQEVDYEDEDEEQGQASSPQMQKPKQVSFAPAYLAVQCAKHHKVAYIWYGNNQIPPEYEYLLAKCQSTAILLTQTDFQLYSHQWNQLSPPQYQILPEAIPLRQRVNILKLLYLYFESGIYADFDTQINEACFEHIYANEIIFTNRVEENINIPLFFPVQQIVVPEESFMMVRKPFHPQVKRMIMQEILEHDNGGGDRWRQCKYRQCLIVECQRHYRDNTYKKGYV